MAETAKILSPEKTVLIPGCSRAGCSLADSITGADIRLLRERYPGVPVVTYVNTSAEVKAETDICCTSSNAVEVVESLGAPRVLMLPDEYLASWVARQTDVEIISWHGHCEVHERFTAEELRSYREGHDDIVIIAHPECPQDVLDEADFVGSTSAMIGYVGDRRAEEGGDGHRVLDERQRRRGASGGRVHPSVQPLPAHEADHPAEDPSLTRDHDRRGDGRSRSRRARAPGGGADARDRRQPGAASGRRSRVVKASAPELERIARELHCDEARAVDVVVVGAGVGGLAVALAASGPRDGAACEVAMVTKGRLGLSGSSPYAQGGIAAAVAAEDSASEHAEDTRRVGRGLNDAGVVDLLTQGGAGAVEQLIAWGARFDRDPDGRLDLGREAGHSHHRILHAGGDATGREVVRAMTEEVSRRDNVSVYEDFFAWDLVRDDQGSVVGLVGLHAERRIALLARDTVLAAGGVGQLYLYTTNPRAVTGDGVAMAARAGARLVDLEFVQFHPTTLAVAPNAEGQVPLLTEALRGDGAWLVDEHGRRFMFDVDDAGELAPRDVVARTLYLRAQRGEKSFLDLRPVAPDAETLRRHFPTADRSCRAAGLDPMREPVPVTPAAHYYMGGVWADGSGKNLGAGALGVWRGLVDGGSRCQPPGQQFSPRGPGLRPARRRRRRSSASLEARCLRSRGRIRRRSAGLGR